MKRLGIDARLINQTGVGVYTKNLLKHLEDMIDSDVEVYVYLRSDDYDSIVFKNKNFVKRRADFKWHTFSEQTGFLKLLTEDAPHLMHFTYFSYPMYYPLDFVITIHDLTILNHATGQASTKNPLIYKLKHAAYQILLKRAIQKSKAIITPSKAVKSDIMKAFGAYCDKKIYITYEGVNEKLLTAKENVGLKKRFSKPFYIYVGNFYPHKNVENLIRAFAKSDSQSQLILIGPNDYFSQRMRTLIKNLEQQKNILLYHDAPIEDLIFFYKNAQALIHPSITEGFGLPLVEAQHFGCPVIASDIPIFSETMGNSYTAFNPQDVNDIAEKIQTASLKRKKADVSKKFSFKKMARKTYKLYMSIIPNPEGSI